MDGGAWQAAVPEVAELDTTEQLGAHTHTVDSQYCVSFRHTDSNSVMCIYSSDSLPLQIITKLYQ